jgi:hypothetical protein
MMKFMQLSASVWVLGVALSGHAAIAQEGSGNVSTGPHAQNDSDQSKYVF